MFSLKNKIAVVTGASQGIGKTISKIFSKAGAHVVCVARNTTKLKNLVDEILKNGNSASCISCDINDGKLLRIPLDRLLKTIET